jgi:isopenicillin N synthase-like dioxygenase
MLGPMTTDRADGWMPLEATLHPHELLLYAGKALEHASAGAIPALLHRVRAPPCGRERFSAPYFLRPSADVALPPVPGGGPHMISANDFLRCAVAARDVRVPPEENVRSLRVARQAV